jgi:hypothetical protein
MDDHDQDRDEIELEGEDIEIDWDQVDDETLEAIAGGCHAGEGMAMSQGFDWAGWQKKMQLLSDYSRTREQTLGLIKAFQGDKGPLGKLFASLPGLTHRRRA